MNGTINREFEKIQMGTGIIICGLNGAGKSTTIKLILDMIRKDSGTITLFGQDNQKNTVLTKQDIGVVLDEAYFPEILSAVQVGKIMEKTYRRWDMAAYQGYLNRFALPEKKPFKDLSLIHI
mgnify:FL=1